MSGDRVGRVFTALGDPTRRHVVGCLTDRGPMTATELAEQLPVSRQAVAKHLATLQRAGLVASERSGRETRYRLTPGPMAEAMGWMADAGAQWDDRLRRLRRFLATSE